MVYVTVYIKDEANSFFVTYTRILISWILNHNLSACLSTPLQTICINSILTHDCVSCVLYDMKRCTHATVHVRTSIISIYLLSAIHSRRLLKQYLDLHKQIWTFFKVKQNSFATPAFYIVYLNFVNATNVFLAL